MQIVGCDLHTRYQQIAMLDSETGEVTERRVLPPGLGNCQQHRPDAPKQHSHSQHHQRQGEEGVVPARPQPRLCRIRGVIAHPMPATNRELLGALQGRFVIGALEACQIGGDGLS